MEDGPFWSRQRLLFLLVIITFFLLVVPPLARDLVRPGGAVSPVSAESVDLRSVNINRASATVLETLPGLGPSLAAKVVEEGARGGPFSSVKDLERVKGIGPAKARTLEPYLFFE